MKSSGSKTRKLALQSNSTSHKIKYETQFSAELNRDNTNWVFIAGEAEVRHLLDISWAVLILLARKVSPKNIFIWTDHPFPEKHLFINLKDITLGQLGNIQDEYSSAIKSENVVVTVTGHGSRRGIPVNSKPDIKPFPFLEILKSSPGLKTLTLVLTQCYAGLFNYLNVRGDTKICIIGATNLHVSISALAEYDLPTKDPNAPLKINWEANVFMLRFFNWLLQPEDVDGDNKISVLDGYRRAGLLSNDHFRQLKADVDLLLEGLRKDADALSREPLTDDIQARKKQLDDQIQETINSRHYHQEPWVLHADLARDLILAL